MIGASRLTEGISNLMGIVGKGVDSGVGVRVGANSAVFVYGDKLESVGVGNKFP